MTARFCPFMSDSQNLRPCNPEKCALSSAKGGCAILAILDSVQDVLAEVENIESGLPD